MQGRGFRQQRIWLLAGTGEGPQLAAALERHGWRVSVSVVTASAARAYAGFDLDQINVGALQGPEAITAELMAGSPFHCVVDATHPFACQISADLQRACAAADQPLLRFERALEGGKRGSLLNQWGDLERADVRGRRLFLAIGGRHLPMAHAVARAAGAEVFARCLPSATGLRLALAAGLSQGHLAVLRPLQGADPGAIERALCRRWGISTVLCRQSGGVTERLWRRISDELDLDLLLLRRPSPPAGVETVSCESDLLRCLSGSLSSPLKSTHD